MSPSPLTSTRAISRRNCSISPRCSGKAASRRSPQRSRRRRPRGRHAGVAPSSWPGYRAFRVAAADRPRRHPVRGRRVGAVGERACVARARAPDAAHGCSGSEAACPPAFRFAVGPIPAPGSDPRTAPVTVVAPGPEETAVAESVSSVIEDPELREIVRRAAAASLAAHRSDRHL